MKREIETRCLSVDELELRVKRDDDGKVKIVGYAAVFDKLSEDLGGFREKIQKGAFKDALKKSDARALWNHDNNYVLGRESSGTLKLKEDDKGLYMEVDPPDTQFAKDLMVSIERGDVNQQSFGFYIKSDKWEGLDSKNETIRTILEVDEIVDVSPVTFPAYPDTKVALRSLDAAKKDVEIDVEDSNEVHAVENRNRNRTAIREREILNKIKSKLSEV